MKKKNKVIVVCEDDKSILDVVTIILSEIGVHIHAFEGCENIVELAISKKADLILMDLSFPPEGGEILIQKLRQNEKTKDIPIIIMSGSMNVESVASRHKVHGYLKKPFGVEELISSVTQQIKAL